MTKMKQLQKCLTQLMRLAQLGKYCEGLKVVNKYLKLFPSTDEVLLQRAFFLYHYAASLKYPKRGNKKPLQAVKFVPYFDDAIKTCRGLIKKRELLSERIYLNARIYLAQIYVMLGKSSGAKMLAQRTYKSFPSALTAERVADIHWRLNDLRGAMRWYKIAVKKAQKADEKVTTHAGLAMLYRHLGKVEKALEEVRIAIYFFKRAKHPKLLNPKLLIKILRSHIPELKKTTLLV